MITNIPSKIEDMIKERMATGMYGSSNEVLERALYLLEDHDLLQEAKLNRLRGLIQEGIDSGPAGNWDSDEVKKAGRAMLEKEKKHK